MGKRLKLWKRILSIFLAVTLSLSSFIISAGAEGRSYNEIPENTADEARAGNPNGKERTLIVEAENAQLNEPGDFSDDTDSASHGGKHIRTQKAGASVTLTFTGTGIRFYAKKGSGAGVLRVDIDGELHGKADEYVSGSPEFQSKTYEALNLSEKNAEHTIVLTAADENPNGINGSPWFNFDYFEVIQCEEEEVGDTIVSPGDTDYYLDSEAAQNGDGSQESPFNTLIEINRREFAPGDHIYIKRGSVFRGLLYPKGSGSADKPILLDAYGEGEKPLIDGDGRYGGQQEYGAEGPFGEAAAAVYLHNSQYWEISDLKVTNWDEDTANRERSGIRIEASGGGIFRHIYIKNCEIFNVRGYRGQDSIWDVDPVGGGTTFFGSRTTHRTGGINFCSYTGRENNASDKTNPGKISDSEPTIFDDVLIEGNNIENCDANGITTTNVKGEMDNRDYRHKNVVIRRNSITNVQRAGIVPLYTDGALVEHNKVDTFQQTTEGYGCGIWCDRANDMVFQYNEVCNGQNTMDGMAFNLDDMTENGVIQYNYTHNNVGGGTMLHVRTNSYNRNNTIRYNLSVNDTHNYAPHQAIVVCVGEDGKTKIESARVYNNTFFNTRTVRPVYKGDEIAFENNIFYLVNKGMKNKTNAYDVGSKTIFNHNLFAGVHPQDEPSGNENISTAMPGLAGVLVEKDGDQYLPKGIEEAMAAAMLAHASQALNAGTVMEDGVEEDLYGNPVTAGEAPNIGVYNGVSVEKTEYEDFSDITEVSGEPSEFDDFTIEYVEGEDERVSKNAAFKTNPGGAHGGFHISSDEDGASAEYTFTGKAISVYTKSGGAAGVANIYLDGQKAATDDQYEGKETFGRMAFTRTFAESGTHTIKIERSGMKNPSSSGTNLNLDYFKVFKECQPVVPEKELIKMDASGFTAEAESVEEDEGPASCAIDGNSNTYWHSNWSGTAAMQPDFEEGLRNGFTIDLGGNYNIQKLEYLPRQDQNNGTITKYRLFYSKTEDGEFLPIPRGIGYWEGDSTLKSITFEKVNARRIQIRAYDAVSDSSGKNLITAAEFYVYRWKEDGGPVTPPDRSFHVPPAWNQGDTHITLPKVADGWEIELFGSDRKEVVGLDNSVTRPLEDVTVNLLYKLTNRATGEVLETNVNAQITIPAAPMEDFVSGSNEKPGVIPALREWKGASGEIKLTNTSRIVVDSESFRQDDAVHVKENLSKTDNFYTQVNMFKEDLKAQTGLDLPIVTDQEPGTADIYFTAQGAPASLGAEGYMIEFGGQNGDGDSVIVRAPQKTGILYGGITILQILKQNTALSLPRGICRDYPAYEKRGYMLDAARIYLPLEYLEDTLKQMAWYKMNTFSVHLNDCENWGNLELGQERYSAFRLESNVPGLTAEDGSYTKDEFREFQYDAVDLGINVIPEFDTPGHSLAFTRVWPELAREDNAKYLDVTNPQVLEKVKALFDEYILPQNGKEEVFIGPEVNIGTDEYKTNGLPESDRARYREAFRGYIDQLLQHVKNRGKEPAFWGCLRENAGSTPVTTDALMYAWYWDYSEALKALEAGYRVLTMDEMETYIVPGGGWYVNQYGRGEHLYNTWLPNDNRAWDISFSGDRAPAPKGHPRVVGGQFAVWNDWIGNGISTGDISFRIQYNIPAIAQKSWSVDESNASMNYTEFKRLGEIIGDAPGSDFLYRNNRFTKDKILDLGEEDDISNQTDMQLDPVNVGSDAQGKDGTGIRFNGKDSYIESDVDSTGFDWTVGMWINPDEGNAADAVLMEGKTGTLKLKQGKTGKIGYSVGNYDHYFHYRLPEGRWTHIALTGDAYGVKLYANGIFIDELKDKPWPNLNFDSNFAKPSGQPNFIPTYFETLMLPTSVLGSKTNAFKGVADDFRIYNRVLEADEILEMTNIKGDASRTLAAKVNEANELLDSGRLSEDPEAKTAMLNAVKAAANVLANPAFTEEQIKSADQALQAEVEKAPADPADINLMADAYAATSVECHTGFGPEKMVDGDDALESRLATKRGVKEVPVEFTLAGEKTFNTLVIKEGLGPITGETLAAQIKGYEIQVAKNGKYEDLLSAVDQSAGIVGEKLTIDLGQDVTASKIRVIFKVNPEAGINIKEAELYRLLKPQPYVNETARDVVNYLGIPERLELTDTHLPISEMPGAYSSRIIASGNSDIIALDGTVVREDTDQTVTILMEVTKRKGTNTILEKAVMPYTVVVAGLQTPAVIYRVTFHANGGTAVNPASTEAEAGEAIGTLPVTTREGYEFQGWFTAQTGGTRVTEATVVNSDMDLYAQWKAIQVTQTHTVTFHANGGTAVNPASIETESGKAIGSLPSTTREGYEFQGWFTAQTGGTKVTEATVVTSDMTLYAQWKKMMQPQPKPEVSFTETEYSLYATQTIKTSVNANAAAGAVTGYKSSNTKVAVVTSAGVIKGIRKGSATITVSTSGKGTATVNVTVKTPKISLTAKKAKLQAGKSTKAITIKSKIKTDKVVKFTSSKKKIASVNHKGKIKGIKAGKTRITVFMKSGARASCVLTVQKAPVKTTKIKVPKKVTLKVKEKQKIEVVRKPVTAADKIDYRSSDSKIAKVDKKGIITAKKAGSCHITVTCNKITKRIRVIVERR